MQFYKKTKQLPTLGKCCEEIQPHQWKPPVEREEHRLPFWLKVNLLLGEAEQQAAEPRWPRRPFPALGLALWSQDFRGLPHAPFFSCCPLPGGSTGLYK